MFAAGKVSVSGNSIGALAQMVGGARFSGVTRGAAAPGWPAQTFGRSRLEGLSFAVGGVPATPDGLPCGAKETPAVAEVTPLAAKDTPFVATGPSSAPNGGPSSLRELPPPRPTPPQQ